MSEKCFCHVIDSLTGETYVVKDKTARELIATIQETVTEIETELDGKLTRSTGPRETDQVYAVTAEGISIRKPVTTEVKEMSIPFRDMSGHFDVLDAVTDDQPVTKRQLDAKPAKLYRHYITIEDPAADEYSEGYSYHGVVYSSSAESLVGKWPPAGTFMFGTLHTSPDGTGFFDIYCTGYCDDIKLSMYQHYCATDNEDSFYNSYVNTIYKSSKKITTDVVSEV